MNPFFMERPLFRPADGRKDSSDANFAIGQITLSVLKRTIWRENFMQCMMAAAQPD
jgi:hypothetical protein